MLTRIVLAGAVLYLGVRVYMSAWGTKFGATPPTPPPADTENE